MHPKTPRGSGSNSPWPWLIGLGVAATAVRFALRRRRRLPLEGKNALVTGGGDGLGLEIARQLVERGVNVAVVGGDEKQLEQAVGVLKEKAGEVRVVGVPCDLHNATSINAMIRAVRAELGPVDLLVNNASGTPEETLDSLKVSDFEQAMKLNCYAALRTSLAVRADMQARGGGRIANIASGEGTPSVPSLPHSVSQRALTEVSQGLQDQFAKDGIFVSTISPCRVRPGAQVSVFARRAARKIVSALEYGDAHVALGLPAKLGAAVNEIVPAFASRPLAVTPAANDDHHDGKERPRGKRVA